MRPHVLHWLEGFVRPDVANAIAPSWFMCVGLAGLVSLILIVALARRRGIDTGTVASAVLWCYVAAVAAGIAMPMLIDAGESLVTTGRLRLHWAGMTSFWGYLAGAGAVVLVCKRDGLPLARMGDLAVIPLGVALAFARLGCFVAGCDYGKVSSLPWAVRFPAGSPAWRDHVHAGLLPSDRVESLPVHPTQLYEAMLGLVIVAMAIVVARRLKREGQLFVLAAATYAIGRIIIEMFRGDAGRGLHAGLSSGQIFSLLVLAAIAARHLVARRRLVMAVATAALVFAVADVGEADAQPGATAPQPPDDLPPPPEPPLPQDPAQSQLPPDLPPLPPEDMPPQPMPNLGERPKYEAGILLGTASAINRRANQVPTLAGATLSFGYLPGYLGAWIDLDSFANSEASHTTLLISGSATYRFSRAFAIGGRLGIGPTRVDFKDPAFHDVLGTSLRVEAIAEYAFTRNWALWVRPLTIDMLSSAELGGPVTTYQFRAGVTFRFGSRHNAVPAAQPLPPLQPPALPPVAGVP
jgi:phosphatidylglycerol:prolipoprotein diacylglycerol transferase